MKLKDLVKHFRNPINKQEKLEIKKLELKKHNLKVEDLLNLDIAINRKLKRFDEI